MDFWKEREKEGKTERKKEVKTGRRLFAMLW